MRTHAFLALLAAASLAGCMMGPNYKRPEIVTPPAWRDLPAAEAESLANTPWWELFQDPELQAIIRTALAENKDLKIAVERIEEARARHGFTRADLYPMLNVFGSGSYVQPTEDGLTPIPEGIEDSLYQVHFNLSWEIDFFGRIRRATEAARAELLATDEARRAVAIALVSDVASTYLELRAFDGRLAIARRTLESRREYVDFARLRFEGGVTAELDFRQAEAEYHRTDAAVFSYERRVAETENALAVLLGGNPRAIPRGRPIEQATTPPAVPAGLPSALLERRPDIRRAEQDLVAANARIGEAKALLFPRIALTGFFGWETTDIDDLFSGPSKAWSVGAGLLQPIFNAGKNRRRVEVTESRQRQTLYAYELAILRAFREVEDALVGYRKSGGERAAQGNRVAAERKRLELSELRYRGGVADYLEVLDAQRSLFAAEIDEVQSIQDQLVAVVRLFKALGGGWPEVPAVTASGGATPVPTPAPE